jgi:hypothetical protein
VDSRELRFDEAFEAYVALEAARVLHVDAQRLLRDAKVDLQVDPIAFTWPTPASTHTESLLRRIQTAL